MLGVDRDVTLVGKLAQNIQSPGFHSKHSIKLDMVSYSLALGGIGRSIRSSRFSSTTQQVQDQPGLEEALSQRQRKTRGVM